LTYEQRYHIYLLNKQGYNQTFIAKSMGRNGLWGTEYARLAKITTLFFLE
jgi:hypothetical protein